MPVIFPTDTNDCNKKLMLTSMNDTNYMLDTHLTTDHSMNTS